MDQLINTQDYSYFQLSIALIGSILWIVTYLLLVKDAWKHKFMEMPFFAVCGNLAWEFLYAFVFVDHINLGKLYTWGYQAWFFIDLIIVFFVFKYGKKQVQTKFVKKHFYWLFSASAIGYVFLLYFWITMGFDNTPFDAPTIEGSRLSPVILGATSAFFLNGIISVLYIRLFMIKSKSGHFSLLNAVCRWLGTALFTVLFYTIDPENHIITLLGIVVFISDVIYISLLIRNKESKKIKQVKNVDFPTNAAFENLWHLQGKTETYYGIEIRSIQSDHWKYKSDSFDCEFKFYEGNLLVQNAIGKMTDDDADYVLPMIDDIIKELEIQENYYFLTDSRGVKMAEPYARRRSLDLFQNDERIEKIIIVVSPIVKSMIRLAPIKSIVNKFIVTRDLNEAFLYFFNILDGAKLSSLSDESKNDTIDNFPKNIEFLLTAVANNEFNKVEGFIEDDKSPYFDIYEGFKVITDDKKQLISKVNDSEVELKNRLMEQQSTFNSLFNNSGLYSIIIDTNYNLLDYNPFADELFKENGISLKKGHNISNFLSSKNFNALMSQKAYLEDIDRLTFEHKEIFPNNQERWFQTVIFKLSTAQNQDLFGLVASDITSKKKLEVDKLKLLEDLKSRNKYLQDFHFTISHHLNHEIARIEQIVGHLNDPLIDVRKKMELIENLAEASDKLSQVKSELNDSLNETNTDEKQHLIPTKKNKTKTEVRHVTLIDDDPITNSVNKITIKNINRDLEISTFKNAKKAIETFLNSDNLPDIIFLDINMPHMNGWEFLEEFSEFATKNKIAINMLSSSESKSEKRRAMEYECVTGFISKPLNAEKLAEAINIKSNL